MLELTLNAASTDSKIYCGGGAFEKYAPKLKDKQIYIVTDSNVFALYRHLLWDTFGNDFGITIIPAGESSKSSKYLLQILKDMLKTGMRRGGYVVAFGGGVVGDIAGLAASLYMRGIHLVQIPTTLLAQVDSSVGGKTAIDLNGVKNVIGTFYQPEEVIVDPRFLKTLPEREIRCGLGEIIKYGALSKSIFNKLMQNIDSLKDFALSEEIIYDCIAHKAEVVAKDERDLSGERFSLNLGHTTGHALELFYRKKSHGEFVLIGTFYELYIAEKSGICGGQYAEDLKKLMLAVLKKAPYFADIKEAAKLALSDKKNSGNEVTLIVPKGLGECQKLNLDFETYARFLEECSQSL